MPATPSLPPASRSRFAELPTLIYTFVESLSEEPLARLYRSFGRIWLDSGDLALRLSFGPPWDRSAHSWMYEEPSAGKWVYASLEMDTHEDHPWDEDGFPTDWVPNAAWTRALLLAAADDIADDLLRAAESDDE